MRSNTQFYTTCSIIRCAITIIAASLMLGCSVSKSVQPTSIASETIQPSQKIEAKEYPQIGPEKPEIPDLQEIEKKENIIYRDETGAIAGKIKIAVLRMDEASTSGFLKWIEIWKRSLEETEFGKIKIILETPQPPDGITTTAPLLFVAAYPSGLRGQRFIQQLERYVQRGGLVLFNASEPPRQLFSKGIVRQVSDSHPILTFPYKIEGLSKLEWPKEVEIGGKTAAFAFGLGNSPTYLRIGVNLIAYALSRHPEGKVYLKKEFRFQP